MKAWSKPCTLHNKNIKLVVLFTSGLWSCGLCCGTGSSRFLWSTLADAGDVCTKFLVRVLAQFVLSIRWATPFNSWMPCNISGGIPVALFLYFAFLQQDQTKKFWRATIFDKQKQEHKTCGKMHHKRVPASAYKRSNLMAFGCCTITYLQTSAQTWSPMQTRMASRPMFPSLPIILYLQWAMKHSLLNYTIAWSNCFPQCCHAIWVPSTVQKARNIRCMAYVNVRVFVS